MLTDLTTSPASVPDLVTPVRELRRITFETLRAISYPKDGMSDALGKLAVDAGIVPEHLSNCYRGLDHLTKNDTQQLLAAVERHSNGSIVREQVVKLLGDLSELMAPPAAAILSWYLGREYHPKDPLASILDITLPPRPDSTSSMHESNVHPVVFRHGALSVRSPLEIDVTLGTTKEGDVELLILPRNSGTAGNHSP